MLFMAILETMGVASILPFMQVVSNPSLVQQNYWLSTIYRELNFSSTGTFLTFLGISALIIIAVNNGFSAFTTWLMYKFAWSQNHRLSTRLLERYIDRPWSFYLSRNTAEMSKNILSEVQIVIQGVLLAALRFVSRVAIVLLMIAVLAVANVRLALTVGIVLGGAYGLVYVFIRRKQRRLGKERLLQNGRRFQVSGEALAGIKELKVLGRERLFLRRFKNPSSRYCSVGAANQVVGALPRYALETIAYGGVLLIVLYSLRTSGDIRNMLPVLSLYVFAGYRLMPSLNEIFTTAVLIRFNRAPLERLHSDLADIRMNPSERAEVGRIQEDLRREPLPFRKEYSLKDVSYTYPGADSSALCSISLSIFPHQVIGVVGTTGAGKTTLVDIILGLLEPTSGSIEVDGEAMIGERVLRWQKSCGYIPQVIFLSDDTIEANIAFGLPSELVNKKAVERAAAIAQINTFIDSLPNGYATEVGERGVRLSGGQRQRIGIARALYHDPAVLVMDEATSSLDGATEAAVMQMMQQVSKMKTLIVIAHRLTTIEACDVIVLLDKGQVIAEGTYTELSESNPYFRSMAGLERLAVESR
jgi:ABC-type multidrug transport system fused ATPase/permease subunit